MADDAPERSALPVRSPRLKRAAFVALSVAWLGLVGVGMKVMLSYAFAPGVAADAPARWPSGSALTLDRERPTLLVVAHPRCPCTRATIGELAELMARFQGRISAQVVFIKPAGVAAGFEQSDLWRSAERIPGVHVVLDEGGREAALFGSKTSGQALLYAKDGELLFAGGITATRGHMGDNVGIDRITSLLEHGRADRSTSSVFGCALFSEEAR